MRLRTAVQDALARRDVARRARTLHAAVERVMTPTGPERPAFLAAVAICRGEDDYLVEWLEFHRMMGVEHFFIYDNGVASSTRKLLEPYMAERLVSYIPFPDLDWPGLRTRWDEYGRASIQELAYGHCVTHFRQRCRFLAKFDVDEFIYPAQERHATVVEAMRSLDLERTVGIEIPMLDFGSSGHLQKPAGLVIEAYTRALGANDNPRRIKSIANTAFIADGALSHPHSFRYRVPLRSRLAGARKVRGAAATALLRLNHYYTKSLEEYLRKGELNARGYLANKESQTRFFGINAYANAVENRAILRFVPALRARLRRQ